MRTKAFILAIGCPWLSFASSVSAQSTTLTVPSGEYRLIAGCRLQTIQTAPPNTYIGQPPQFEVVQYNSALEAFVTFQPLLGGWAPSQPTFGPGEGGFFQVSGGDATLVFQQRTPTRLPLVLTSGFVLVCCQSNIPASFEDIMGTPPANGTMLYQFNPGPGRNPYNLAAPDYTIFTFAKGAWSPTNPVVGITEAVFVYQPPQLANFQVTENGISFEISPPFNQPFAIEYTDSLTRPAWQTLTNVVGNGAPIRILDSSIGISVRQRFYRAKSSN